MDVVGTSQPSALLSIGQYIPDLLEGVEFNSGRRVADGVDDHPLADQQVPSDRHRARQQHVRHQTNEEPVAQTVGHLLFEEGDVIAIVGPLAEIVESSVEETVHHYQQDGEVGFVEERNDDQEQIHRSVVDHFEDEALDLVANIGQNVDPLFHVSFGHELGTVLMLPGDDLHGLVSHVHVVENQVAVGEDQRQPRHDQVQPGETQP